MSNTPELGSCLVPGFVPSKKDGEIRLPTCVHCHVASSNAGGYAATEISSTSRSMSGYQRLKMAPNSPLSVRTRVCSNKWAPSLDHCICCFLQKRLLTTSFTVDSTNPVAIAWPL